MIRELVSAEALVQSITAGSTTALSPTDASPTSPVDAADGLTVKLQKGINQAFIVGQQIISFDAEVTEKNRRASLISTLFAQLLANRNVPRTDANKAYSDAWYADYTHSLTQIAWDPKVRSSRPTIRRAPMSKSTKQLLQLRRAFSVRLRRQLRRSQRRWHP